SHHFEHEARLLANLNYPTLPRVTDHFIDDTGQFLVMEYIPGEDLEMMLVQRGKPFPVAQVLAWADQLLDTLRYLHTRKPPVIHRDIKPHNLKLISPTDIMLLDFGIAKGSAAELGETTTYTKSLMAYTRGYAPLEQVLGKGTDARSDLYALAATLHRLLTFVKPVDAELRKDIIDRGHPDPVPPPHELNREVPEAVSAVLMQALALEPHERPVSAAAMRAALEAARD